MKVCLLGDTHWGCRNDLALFYGHFETFYNDLFDDLESQGITDIFQLGDLFDRRKYINFRTLAESKRIFFDKLVEKQMTLHVLVGNHDIHMRESVDINSPSLVLKEYSNVIVYDKPATVDLDGVSVDIVPWICRDNQTEVLSFINDSKSDVCLGHFEIAGFAMYRGLESHEGLSADMFLKYAYVFSGHYHTRSQKNNIVYVGTPYEMTWQDYNDPKGYHILDTEQMDVKFVRNKNNIFERIEYDDTKQIPAVEDLKLTNKFVKLVVTNKTDLFRFDNFLSQLYTSGAYEIKIVEDLTDFTDGEVGESINLEDTLVVLSNYIDSIETNADKEKIKNFMKTLYVEALNQEIVE